MSATTLTYERARDRVEQGAEFLDEVAPGWDKRLDGERLDINSCTDCVLGQLYGHFTDAVEQLELSLTVTRALGLNYEARSNKSWLYHYGGSSRAADEDAERAEAKLLRQAWLELLERRRTAA